MGNVNVMRMVVELFNGNSKVHEIATTENYGVIGHLAYMLANTWNKADEVYVQIRSAWGEIEGLTPNTISESTVEAVALAYESLDTEFKLRYSNELRQDQRKVCAVLNNVGKPDVVEAR